MKFQIMLKGNFLRLNRLFLVQYHTIVGSTPLGPYLWDLNPSQPRQLGSHQADELFRLLIKSEVV